jgi:hypothetical protein
VPWPLKKQYIARASRVLFIEAAVTLLTHKFSQPELVKLEWITFIDRRVGDLSARVWAFQPLEELTPPRTAQTRAGIPFLSSVVSFASG